MLEHIVTILIFLAIYGAVSLLFDFAKIVVWFINRRRNRG